MRILWITSGWVIDFPFRVLVGEFGHLDADLLKLPPRSVDGLLCLGLRVGVCERRDPLLDVAKVTTVFPAGVRDPCGEQHRENRNNQRGDLHATCLSARVCRTACRRG